MKNKDEVRKGVSEAYARAVSQPAGCCCGGAPEPKGVTAKLGGYSPEELMALPADAVVNSFGCGNPVAMSGEGQVVLDLGAGAGIDLLLAARRVGASGRVIGVDMTDAMIEKARENIRRAGLANVEVRKGVIEELPVESASVDWVISNCVINLSTDKPQVFREAFRVLKNGGRLAVSDMVASAEIPAEIKGDIAQFAACVAGAASVDAVHAMLKDAGFADIRIRPKEESREFVKDWAPGKGLENFVLSASIEAVKP